MNPLNKPILHAVIDLGVLLWEKMPPGLFNFDN